MASEQPPVQPPGEAAAGPAVSLEKVAEPLPEVITDSAAEPLPEIVPFPSAPSAKANMITRIGNYASAHPVTFGIWVTLIVALLVGFIWPNVPAPHVALGGEPINSKAPSILTNSMLTTLIVDAILLLIALAVGLRMKLVPTGIQNLMEMVIEYFYALAEQIAGKAARTYFPWIMTIFLFVIVSNWFGLLPGVGSIGWVQTREAEQNETAPAEEGADPEGWNLDAQLAMADGSLILLSGEAAPAAAVAEEYFIPLFRVPSADLNFTFALAASTMFLVQVWGVRALGLSYFRKFFTLAGKGMMKPINAFVGILELISEISRILSFGFRLFGNIFAGEIVLATMAFLAAFIMPVPFYILELFVGFVQALVFTMLALVFFTMSTIGHHDDSHDHKEAHGEAPAAVAAAAH